MRGDLGHVRRAVSGEAAAEGGAGGRPRTTERRDAADHGPVRRHRRLDRTGRAAWSGRGKGARRRVRDPDEPRGRGVRRRGAGVHGRRHLRVLRRAVGARGRSGTRGALGASDHRGRRRLRGRGQGRVGHRGVQRPRRTQQRSRRGRGGRRGGLADRGARGHDERRGQAPERCRTRHDRDRTRHGIEARGAVRPGTDRRHHGQGADGVRHGLAPSGAPTGGRAAFAHATRRPRRRAREAGGARSPTCDAGRGQVLLLVGDAGLGKTRMLAELRAPVGRGRDVARGPMRLVRRRHRPMGPSSNSSARGWAPRRPTRSSPSA